MTSPTPAQFPLNTEARTMPTPPINVVAIIAFVSSFFLSIAGIVLGIIALVQIRRTGERGNGLAIAAIIIGAFFLLSTIAALIGTVTLGGITVSNHHSSIVFGN